MVKVSNVGVITACLLLSTPFAFAQSNDIPDATPPITDKQMDKGASATGHDEGLGIKKHIMEWTLTDQKFVEKAAEGGRAEIELSKLALQKAQSPQIKSFAQKMIDDHTAASRQLDGIAQNKSLNVPSELNGEHQKALTQLQSESGANFDAKYVDLMKKDHEKVVSLFAAAADDKKLDPQLQSFAQNKLPTLRSHLEHVEMLSSAQTSSASR